MSIYWDKLAHVQVVINCQYSVAQMCTCEDTPVHILGMPYTDDVMSHNELTTQVHILGMPYTNDVMSHNELTTQVNK